MNIDRYIRLITDFITDQPIIAGIILVVLAIFCIKKTKEAIKVGVLLLFLAAGFYVFSLLGDASFSGFKNKSSGTVKSQQALGE